MSESFLQCSGAEEPVVRYCASLGPAGTPPDVQMIISLADLMDYHDTRNECTPEGRKAAIRWFIARYDHE